MKKLSLKTIIVIAFFFTSCSDFIEYSPFDANVSPENINIKSVEKISSREKQEDTIKFALIADSHISYDELKDAVKSINKVEGLKFVVSCGDVTDGGLKQEYQWYREIVSEMKYPVITVIGNHDYLSNGLNIYERMFGPSNMSFLCGDYKFIAFDDVVWENYNRAPNFEWLRRELARSDGSRYSILLAHIPPWTDQLDGRYSEIMKGIISESNIVLSLHGHEHDFRMKTFAGKPAIVSGCVKYRYFNIIKLYGSKFWLERVKF